MKKDYIKDLERFKSQKKIWKQKFKELAELNKNDLDDQFHEAHEEVFQEVDCLDCANCCKTTSPIFRIVDIERLAKHLSMKPSGFIDTYLRIDSDGDYVLQQSPCAFLNEDNTCKVYAFRPEACAGYPHTDRKKMHQILNLTQKNGSICPAVVRILNKLEV